MEGNSRNKLEEWAEGVPILREAVEEFVFRLQTRLGVQEQPVDVLTHTHKYANHVQDKQTRLLMFPLRQAGTNIKICKHKSEQQSSPSKGVLGHECTLCTVQNTCTHSLCPPPPQHMRALCPVSRLTYSIFLMIRLND